MSDDAFTHLEGLAAAPKSPRPNGQPRRKAGTRIREERGRREGEREGKAGQGKGRAMSPISVESSGDRSSEEEEVSFSLRGRSKENDELSSEEEVCLLHDLICVLTCK